MQLGFKPVSPHFTFTCNIYSPVTVIPVLWRMPSLITSRKYYTESRVFCLQHLQSSYINSGSVTCAECVVTSRKCYTKRCVFYLQHVQSSYRNSGCVTVFLFLFSWRPNLFASCNNTFSKWWEGLRMSCIRVLSSTPLWVLGSGTVWDSREGKLTNQNLQSSITSC
jgi:hypothetical protein